MCAGWWGLRRLQAKPEPSQCRANAAALLGLASMRSWMAPEGTAGAGQVVQVARESTVAPPPPSLHEPLPHRGLTFGTRTALSPR